MKIRPDKFSMDFNDSQEYSQQSRVVASSNYPTTYLDLFSKAWCDKSRNSRISDTGRPIYLFIKVIEIMMRDGKRTYMRLRITLKEITIL
jgi:hypothetical protein